MGACILPPFTAVLAGVVSASLLAAGAAPAAAPGLAPDPVPHDAPTCGLPRWFALRASFPRLPPAERHAASLAWDPSYRAWVAAGGLSWLDGDADAERRAPDAGLPRDACFSAEYATGLDGPYENVETTEHFELRWHDLGGVGSAGVARIAESLESAWDVYFGEQGWLPPRGSDAHHVLVVLEQLNAGVGGYAWVAPCGASWMPFFAIDSDCAGDELCAPVVTAHELFHGIQFGYAYTEFLLGIESTPNLWWLEASATYQQGLVVPDDEAILGDTWRWSFRPYVSMESHDPDGHQYGMAVWPLSIETSLQDTAEPWDWHRRLWERLRGTEDEDGRSGFSMREELEAQLLDDGSDFLSEYRSLLVRGAEMDFARYEHLVGPRDVSLYYPVENGTQAEIRAIDLPTEGEVAGGDAREGVEYLGQGYLWFGAGEAGDKKALRLHWEADAADGGPEWVLEFASARAGTVLERLSVEPLLLERTGGSRWEADVQLDGFEEAHDGAWMVASPVTNWGQATGDGAPFRYEARLVEGTGEAGWEDLTGSAGCSGGSCTLARRNASVAAPLLALPVLFRRRGRSLAGP
jgi:hypothetical protein